MIKPHLADEKLLEQPVAPAASSPQPTPAPEVKAPEPQLENTTEIASDMTQAASEPATTAANTESVEPVETPAAEGEPVEKSRTARRINALLAEKARLERELSVRRSAPSVPVTPAQPAPTPSEDSPEYWQKKYQEATDLPTQQAAWNKWLEARDRKLLATSESNVLQRLQTIEAQKQIAAKFTAINQTHPFLSQDTQGQVQLDVNAPVVKTALRQAQEDGIQITNDPMLLYYLHSAQAELSEATSKKANQRVATLENQVQKNGARSIQASRTVSPTRNPSAAQATQIAELEKRSSQGDSEATRELIRMRL